jgi:quercetin 2,3-dioxygenase
MGRGACQLAKKETAMAKARGTLATYSAQPTREGAGVYLRRAFGATHSPLFDPFLMLDDFRSSEPARYRRGFPWHPHRGIETVTYLLRGDIEHADSAGNGGVIKSGCAQWMTAGRGVVHQEMPVGDDSGVLEGFQLWVNLPASHKMVEPSYRQASCDDIPLIVTMDGVAVRIISGTVDGVAGPVKGLATSPEFLDITVPPQSRYVHPTPSSHTVCAYAIAGSGSFTNHTRAEDRVFDGSTVLFGEGDLVTAITREEPLRFLLCSGRPIREPVAWSGPIVMNTQQELERAFDELQAGTFLHGGVV